MLARVRHVQHKRPCWHMPSPPAVACRPCQLRAPPLPAVPPPAPLCHRRSSSTCRQHTTLSGWGIFSSCRPLRCSTRCGARSPTSSTPSPSRRCGPLWRHQLAPSCGAACASWPVCSPRLPLVASQGACHCRQGGTRCPCCGPGPHSVHVTWPPPPPATPRDPPTRRSTL